MDQLHRLLIQHARASQHLGVDVVPVGVGGGSGRASIGELVDGDRSAGVLGEEGNAAQAAASEVEVKGVEGAASLSARAPVDVRVGRGESAEAAGDRADGRASGVVAAGSDRASRREETARRLAALRERYEREAPHQHFVTAHTKIVWGDGDPAARLLFVGEAPGADEDRIGRPFVGRSGQLLDKMIVAMGLTRESVYICNVLKTRPPDNATPTSEEIRLCAPYLFEQIGIVDPEVIVTLGLPAVRALLDTQASMSSLRGKWQAFRPAVGLDGRLSDREYAVMPTYHPAFVLRQYTAEVRGKVWSDLQMVQQRLGVRGAGGEVQ